MSKDWNYSEGSRTFKRWLRSPDQIFIGCQLGTVPAVRAQVEEVTLYDDGECVSQVLGTAEIAMSELPFEQMQEALGVQRFLTGLLEAAAIGVATRFHAAKAPAPVPDELPASIETETQP